MLGNLVAQAAALSHAETDVLGPATGAAQWPANVRICDVRAFQTACWCSILEAVGRAGFLSGAGLSVPRDTGTATHAMMSVMWAYMGTWIIKDRAAELARGSHLRGVGLRADCLSVGPARTVAADYEWDAFGLPDLRSDWYVHRLKIEHRQIDYVPGGPGRPRAGRPGKVLRSFEIERMSRWDDDHDPAVMAWYLLDLAPLRAS